MFRWLTLLPLLLKLLLLDEGGEGGEGGTGGEGGEGGEGAPKEPAAKAGEGGGSGDGEPGFPANTPVAEMTLEQQVAYHRHHARKHEERNKKLLELGGGSFDDLKAKVEGYDQHVESSKTEQQRAIDAAKAEGRTEARREAAAMVVDGHVRAAASAGRITEQQANDLLGVLDHSKFVSDDGDVDTDKVATLISSIAPATGDGSSTKRLDLGQGRRPGSGKVSGRDLGKAEAERRFGKRVGVST